MEFRFASIDDSSALGLLNAGLIRDEGHRNPMTASELEDRMSGWLRGEYEAVLCEDAGHVCAYALYSRHPDHVYLRQLFVSEANRRHGVASALLKWLWENPWSESSRVRVEVLVGNSTGIAFWRAVGFQDYCITLEMEQPPGS